MEDTVIRYKCMFEFNPKRKREKASNTHAVFQETITETFQN